MSFNLMCAVAMKHHHKSIGSLGVHVDSDLQWPYPCSIWGPMSHSHQMYTCNIVCMCSSGDGLCARACNAALVTPPPVTCTETNTHVWCLTAVWPPLPVHCVCAAMNLICDAQLVHITTVQTVKLYTSCSQPVIHTHCTTSHYSLHSHTALHHTTAYTLTLHYITLLPTL